MTSSAVAAFAVLPSPFGPIHVAVGERGVVGLQLATATESFRAEIARRVGGPVGRAVDAPARLRSLLDAAAAELAEYAEGRRRAFDLPLAPAGLSVWDRRVLVGVRSIGFGEVTSYGRLARLIGARGAARATGGAVGRNPIGLLIPCHRVIAGDGSLGGYGGSWFGEREELLALKRALLAHEGVTIPTTRLVG